MRENIVFIFVCMGILSGCGKTTDNSKPLDTDLNSVQKPSELLESTPNDANTFALSPENTTIQFVGKHTGEEPDPHTGSFGAFSGSIKHNDGKLSEVNLLIETETITTDDDELTQHLKTPDFFSVRDYPQATFHSTSIDEADGKNIQVTGKLTILGVEQEISFPVQVKLLSSSVTLQASFEIDRSAYGMTFGKGKIENLVQVSVTIGE